MSERTKHHPDTCTCMWCAKELRAELAQCQRDLAACSESRAAALRESGELIAQRDTALGALKAEHLAHAETRKALEEAEAKVGARVKELQGG